MKSGDWGANPCGYADGLKTLELTLACDEAITRGMVRLPAASSPQAVEL